VAMTGAYITLFNYFRTYALPLQYGA
jgi:hypothetical protein